MHFLKQYLHMYIKQFVYVYANNVIILPIHILRHNFKTQSAAVHLLLLPDMQDSSLQQVES